MKLPLDSYLIEYLTEQKYEYWLAKTEFVSGESGVYSVSLIPVHKPACRSLPPGYAYFKIGNETTEIMPGSGDYEINVNLMDNDILLYKRFLIKATDSRCSFHQ